MQAQTMSSLAGLAADCWSSWTDPWTHALTIDGSWKSTVVAFSLNVAHPVDATGREAVTDSV
jgi:hypothetical protein